MFGKFGQISKLNVRRKEGANRSWALVTYQEEASVVAALDAAALGGLVTPSTTRRELGVTLAVKRAAVADNLYRNEQLVTKAAADCVLPRCCPHRVVPFPLLALLSRPRPSCLTSGRISLNVAHRRLATDRIPSRQGKLGALGAVWQRTLPMKEQMDQIRADVDAAYLAMRADGTGTGGAEGATVAALRREVEAAVAAEAEAEAALKRARGLREAAEQSLSLAEVAEAEVRAPAPAVPLRSMSAPLNLSSSVCSC